jgi:hypothetical protein
MTTDALLLLTGIQVDVENQQSTEEIALFHVSAYAIDTDGK